MTLVLSQSQLNIALQPAPSWSYAFIRISFSCGLLMVLVCAYANFTLVKWPGLIFIGDSDVTEQGIVPG